MEDLLEIGGALSRVGQTPPRACEIVELRYLWGIAGADFNCRC